MSQPTLPLTAQVLTQASLTMLAQVLSEDAAAQVTTLEAAPLPASADGTRHEGLRLAWAGPKGQGARELVLTVPPDLTWSEAVNPLIPAPVEVLLVEGDLSEVINSVVEDGAVAARRRRGQRPAWLLRDALPGCQPLPRPLDDGTRHRLLDGSAALHALHWAALPVLDQVYPWLPRFGAWLRAHCASLATHLAGEPPATPYARWMAQSYPHTLDAQRGAWADADPLPALRALLADPAPLLAALAATPQTLLHGNWGAASLCVRGDRLVVTDWGRAQVGPAAWDLRCLLASLDRMTAPDDVARYLDHLAIAIVELDDADRAAFRRGYALCAIPLALAPPASAATIAARLVEAEAIAASLLDGSLVADDF